MEIDVEKIGEALRSAKPINIELDADAAYTLVVFLQLISRHPRVSNNEHLLTIAKATGEAIHAQLAPIDPVIADSLEAGWTPPEGEEAIGYGDLPISLQQELVANGIALDIAISALSKISEMTEQHWREYLIAATDAKFQMLSQDDIQNVFQTLTNSDRNPMENAEDGQTIDPSQRFLDNERN